MRSPPPLYGCDAADDDRVLLSIAPMMEVTDRHHRCFMRSMTKKTRLYTEMLVDDTLHHQLANVEDFIGFDPAEHPLAVQLGGNNPEYLGDAAALCEARGYDEVNLNCGCPSPRVSSHEFGARLMLNPELTRDLCHAMRRRVQTVPVTCKCRLGADRDATYEEFLHFVDTVAACGVDHFIVHARVCILDGLSTKANRSVPPLRYDWVKRAAVERPQLRISLNGGVKTLAQTRELLDWRGGDGGADAPRLESVMIGRAAWHTPWIFADADRAIFGGAAAAAPLTRRAVVADYTAYIEQWSAARGGSFAGPARVDVVATPPAAPAAVADGVPIEGDVAPPHGSAPAEQGAEAERASCPGGCPDYYRNAKQRRADDKGKMQVCFYLPLHFKRILLTILTCPPHILTF